MARQQDETISRLEYHVLLALSPAPLYGYALREAVEEESSGALSPRAASLYRVLARMMERGLVQEAKAPDEAEPHPGRPRQYYGLSEAGRSLLTEESARLEAVASLARERLGAAEGSA